MNTPYVAVHRDPFARGEYARFSSHGPGECAWCGQTKNPVFSYVWWPDDRRPPSVRDTQYWFCNLGCFRSFTD